MQFLTCLIQGPKAKDSRYPALAWLVLYFLLSTSAFAKFSVGSMTAFSDIRNVFSDFWDSVYYACQTSGYTFFRILYPPASSLILKEVGSAISQCREIIGSRGWTLLAYGAIGIVVLFLSYFFIFRACVIAKAPSITGMRRFELFSLSWLLPPTLFGLTRMNTSMVLVPVAMLLIYLSNRNSQLPTYICLAFLPFVKPMFVLVGITYLVFDIGIKKTMIARSFFSSAYIAVNAVAFLAGGYAGRLQTWFSNILSFRSAHDSSWSFDYYSYSPFSIGYIFSNPFLPTSCRCSSLNSTLYKYVVYAAAILATCIVAYAGFHISRTGLLLFRRYRCGSVYQDIVMAYSLLLSCYLFSLCSTTLGPYVLSLATPLVAYISLMRNASRYRTICCALLACSLLPYIPLDIFVWGPKYPTIMAFAILLVAISIDIRSLSSACGVTAEIAK